MRSTERLPSHVKTDAHLITESQRVFLGYKQRLLVQQLANHRVIEEPVTIVTDSTRRQFQFYAKARKEKLLIYQVVTPCTQESLF